MEFTAAIIIRNKNILLLKRSEEVEKGKWNPPNETIEDNEKPEFAVVRGVKEETNLNFRINKFLFPHFYNNLKTYVFLGEASGELIPEPRESSEAKWFTYDEARKLDFAFSYNLLMERLHLMDYI